MENRKFIFSALLILLVSGCAVARDLVVNDARISYSGLLQAHCELFLRHAMGSYPKGYGSGYDWCKKYAISGDNDIINSLSSKTGILPVPILKKDYIPLDEFSVWRGTPPFRARFSISLKYDASDPDVSPSYLPYDSKNKIEDYISIGAEGYEVSIGSGRRTGYRFYEFLGMCYLATENKPRAYKYVTNCELEKGYGGFPRSVDTEGQPWINIMNQNTVDLNESMPAELVEIPGNMPVKPLIYSDFPIGNDGRVTKGRAMCMADCAPRMLMKLLHAGQSIWGPSGKPPVAKH